MFSTNFLPKGRLSALKQLHWLEWAQKILAKRGIATDTDSCAYGKTHLASNVQPVGGGWMFHSKACSGCTISNFGLLDKKLPKGAPNCIILKSPLLTPEPVKEGEKIKLPVFTAMGKMG